MPAIAVTPYEAINQTYLNRPLNHAAFEVFAAALQKLMLSSSDNKHRSEEYHKTLLRDFLIEIGYGENYQINVSESIDLAVFESLKPTARISVMFETKRPGSPEMCRSSDLNRKALQEALLYYLRERIGRVLEREPNLNIKNIVVTDIDNWFVFDSRVFESAFLGDSELVKKFADFDRGHLSATKTEVFYAEIAKPAIDRNIEKLRYTYFRLGDYSSVGAIKSTGRVAAISKFLSPENLLRLPFENVGNYLNQEFYSELLHILGLEEARSKPCGYTQLSPSSAVRNPRRVFAAT